MADEADLAAAQTCLLPEQPHQAVGVGTGSGVTLPVGDKEESSLTSSGDARRNCDGFGMVSPESYGGLQFSIPNFPPGARRLLFRNFLKDFS